MSVSKKNAPYAPLHLALFEPEIAQNVGTLLRLSACLGVHIHVIEPLGFLWGAKTMQRSAMDYASYAHIMRHITWSAFLQWHAARPVGRLLGISGCGTQLFTSHRFCPHDVLLLGKESTGLGPSQKESCAALLRIPMCENRRSLNVAVAASIVVSKALTDVQGWPS